ncbi:MAG TPA: HNH endonuclease, partial [Nocardioides sp.]|nr:HNH endonuclease [Nocardioides sp.]
MATSATDLDTAAAVLEFARAETAAADAAESHKLQAAVAWAAMHSVDSLDQAATVWDRHYGETGLPVAGPGAPLVGEFCVAEFAAAIGLPTEAGKDYLGQAVELRYRLPKVWARVVKGDLPAWRARRVARATIALSVEAAGFVDAHVAHVAHKVRPAQLDRLVEEAIGRFMPTEAARRHEQAQDGRCFTVDTRQPSLAGTGTVYGELDLADALELDAAVAAGAQALADLGSTDTLDVRRATAIGDLARR